MTSTKTSPSSSTTLFPSKKHSTILPNPHPYAIKTTSSAVLSRSNSSPHSAHSVKHRYVPPSPTSPRHRHSSSVSSIDIPQPPPLPIPPSVSPTRARFSLIDDALPTAILNDNAVTEDNRLSYNPKQWSADDLASYIATSLQADNEFSATDQGHLLYTIKEQAITGRDFLRLTDADLASLSLNTAQRLYLLKVSRELRADILRGRIWVDSDNSKNISARSKDIYTQPIRGPRSPFNDRLYRSSVSSDDLILPQSASMRIDGELPLSPARTLNRSNSVSDSSAQRYRDLAHMRMRRRGKVKGLVETWERERGSMTGSEGSMSGSDAESDNDIPSAESPRSPSLSNSTRSLSNPPPPYTSFREDEDEPTIEELLASSGPIEGARAWEEDYGLGETVKRIPTGALASMSFASQPPNTAEAVEIHTESTKCSVDCTLSKLNVARTGRTNQQKRVVTAIFTGGSRGMIDSVSERTSADEVPQVNLDIAETMEIRNEPEVEVAAVESVARHEDDPCAPGQVTEPPSSDDDVIAMLEASIANTRAQLETFRARLEVVEIHIATEEAANQALSHPEYTLRPNEHQPVQSCIPALSDADDSTFSNYNIGLKGFTRSIIARTVGWIYPYSHPRAHPRPEAKAPHSREASHSPVRPRVLPAFRLSYVVMFSFVVCAAVLRRVAFGRGVRGR